MPATVCALEKEGLHTSLPDIRPGGRVLCGAGLQRGKTDRLGNHCYGFFLTFHFQKVSHLSNFSVKISKQVIEMHEHNVIKVAEVPP